VRRILDAGGLADVTIFASGGLDEDYVSEIVRSGAPIDGFGVGTSLTTSSDVPALDCAYKLQEYAGLARRKRSAGKETWPGRKQIWRRYGTDGRMICDLLSLESDTQTGEPLIELVMKNGRRVKAAPTLAEIRARAAHDLDRLPQALRDLEPGATCPVEIADALVRLADEVDNRLAQRETTGP
jgi:nicotinate phosphoribosyltransferase